MKLQINRPPSQMTAYTPREQPPLSEGIATLPNYTERTNFTDNYQSISKVTNDSASPKQSLINHKNFFDNFDTLCRVEHKPVEYAVANVRRKLYPQLQVLVYSPQALKDQHEFELKQNAAPMTFSLSAWLQYTKTSNASNESKTPIYHLQRTRQGVRKINSLIALRPPATCNSIDSASKRRPGFIRLSKSLIKRQSSLQISTVSTLQKDPHPCAVIPASERTSLRGVTLSQQLQSSKQRIAKIRRELTQIYQMRGRGGQKRLRLC